MAWMAHRYSVNMLNITDEKVVIFSPDDCDIYGPSSGWAEIQGVWCSNSIWESRNKWQKTGRTYWYNNKWNDVPQPESERVTYPFVTPPASILPGSGKNDVIEATVVEKSGGASTENPFEKARRLFQAGQLSKNQFKRARKQWEKDQVRSYNKTLKEMEDRRVSVTH
jgi:hypothetical protein